MTMEESSENKQQTPQEIAQLKKELDDLNTKKESEYAQKDEFLKKRLALIEDVKKLRTQSKTLLDQFTKEKEARDKLNTEIKEKISTFKEIDSKKKDLIKKHNISKDPSHVRRTLDQLEERLETTVMSFKKEEELMKQIKDLRKDLAASSQSSGVFEESRSLSKEIDVLKKDANKHHKNAQTFLNERKAIVSQIKALSKEIDALKEKEDASFEEFKKHKEEFKTLNDSLKSKLGEEVVARKEKAKHVKEKKDLDKKKKDAENKKKLEEKEVSVEEKIKKGKKLTTEDLLVFQKD